MQDLWVYGREHVWQTLGIRRTLLQDFLNTHNESLCQTHVFRLLARGASFSHHFKSRNDALWVGAFVRSQLATVRSSENASDWPLNRHNLVPTLIKRFNIEGYLRMYQSILVSYIVYTPGLLSHGGDKTQTSVLNRQKQYGVIFKSTHNTLKNWNM